MALTESDLTEFLRLLERDETLQLDFARAFLKERVVRKLMALDPELREAFRSAVLTEELLRLPTVVAELDQFVRQHAAETDARFDRVEQAIESVREELRGEIQGVRGGVAPRVSRRDWASARGVPHGTTTGASGGERLGSLDTGRVWMP
jgi:hypothetical protein